MKKALQIFVLVFLFIPLAKAQTDIYVVPQLDFGIPLNGHSGAGDELKTRINSYHLQAALTSRIVFARKYGIELGIGQNSQSWSMRDAGFTSRNQGFDVFTNNKFNYYNFIFGFQYNHNLSEYNALYFSAGYSMNMVGKDSLSENKLFVKNNEAIDVTSKYSTQGQSVFAEVGIQNSVNKNDLFVFSLRFAYGLDNILAGTYNVSKEGTALSKSEFNANGTYIGLSMKYNFRVFHKDKRIKPKKDSLPEKKTPQIEIETKKDNKKRTEVPKTVAGRDVKVRKIVKVDSATVQIRVFDAGSVDGDIVSLYFNESTIIENYELKKTPFVTTVTLSEGKNIFVLHALNLGTISPNTAGIIIVSGSKVHKLNLESTLKSSGTIEIDYYPPGTK